MYHGFSKERLYVSFCVYCSVHRYTMKLFQSFFILCLSAVVLQAQYDHVPVFPQDSGTTLYNNLVFSYKPSSLYSYASAKDYMFGTVYKENDTVQCVYTGLKRYVQPFTDPSVTLFDNGSSVSIDTEHTFPQNKGASGTGKSDLHHMYPTKATSNNARGNLPFGNIPDNQVDKWFYLTQEMTTTPPLSERHLYSRINYNVAFQPREDHKGNVARAMFYFYTMYRSDADAADLTFFDNQRATLCDWHFADPVDSLEWIRTYRIAQIQQNKTNPFILDCSLASRLYCSGQYCSTPNVSTHSIESLDPSMAIYPNPFLDAFQLSLYVDKPMDVRSTIMNAQGVVCYQRTQSVSAGDQLWTFSTKDLTQGIYLLSIQSVSEPNRITTRTIICE